MACAFDRKTLLPQERDAKFSDYARLGVNGCVSNKDAISGKTLILSLVTADQAKLAAEESAQSIIPGALFLDLNSVAPDTKKSSSRTIDAAGAHYLDVAVMAPVEPAALDVKLLVSGPRFADGVSALQDLGFKNVTGVGAEVGKASSIKMLRSVIIKGVEALTSECVLAANNAGLLEDVLTALGPDWMEKADYNLDRMLAHGERRAAEMREVAKTLQSFGIQPLMTGGTIERQSRMGNLKTKVIPTGLQNKLDLISDKMDQPS
jgi:3-hydroxyisobutyrate dehydrogenase-like beta-hydroxyacid dehydrogenase